MITNTQLVKYCEQAVGHEYWYGCFGQKATQSLLNSKRKQYPNYYNRSNYNKGWTCDGRRVYDCIGLIKAAVWSGGNFNADPVYSSAQDYSANSMLTACKTKGKIKTLPEVPGVLVFKPGHVGVYIGNGIVIHAAGHNKGVIRDKLSNVAWTDWGKCPLINYDADITAAFSQAFQAAEQTAKQNKVESGNKTTYTHKTFRNVNVRKGPGVTYKRLDYKDFPDYIKKQMDHQMSCLPIGIKIHCYENKKGWYKIDKDKNIYIAGNYTKPI